MLRKIFVLAMILFLTHCTQNPQTIVEVTFDKVNISIARCFILTRPEGTFRETVSDFESLKNFLEKYYTDKQILTEILSLVEYIEVSKQEYMKSYRKLLPISELYVIGKISNHLDNKIIGPILPQEQECHSLDSLKQHLLRTIQQTSYPPPLLNPLRYLILLIILIIITVIIAFPTPVSAILNACQDKIHLLIRKNMKKFTLPVVQDSLSTMVEENSQVTKNIMTTSISEQNPALGWLVVGASAIGKTHLVSNLPCQDSYAYKDMNTDWGIVVLADGAGSAKYSELGAKFVTEEILHRLEGNPPIMSWINKWKCSHQAPLQKHWHALAKQQLKIVKKTLEELTTKKFGSDSKHFACTVIVVIYAQQGLLVTHIGDGRAAYCNEQGEWKAMLTPWKGEEANTTVFLTSDIWNTQLDQFIESQVINEKPMAFAVMSDGCEKHSFECSQFDPETHQWSDPNKPYGKFFHPLVNKLAEMRQHGMSKMEIEARWRAFLEQGTPGLKEEMDDKTMVIGIWN